VIAYVEGILVRRGPESVVAIADGGVALDLSVPLRVAENLPPVGETVRLWTHLIVREDNWTLCGFLQPAEREMFRLLISVSGIGPRVALGILGGATPTDIARFLRNGDERSLTQLPGIGKKSAARLVVELGQRVPETLVETEASAAGGADAGADGTGGLSDAIAVLSAMGLPPIQAERALHQARREDGEVAEEVERWVKAALRFL
jgi:Holliday junction DNA helicase RuvA